MLFYGRILSRELGADDELIRTKLKDNLKLSDEMIDELFENLKKKDLINYFQMQN